MPILDVEVVGDLPEGRRDGLAQKIADAAGAVMASRPQGTWVKLRFLAALDYAENARGPGEGIRPVFVSLLQAEVPEGNARSCLAVRLAEVVAEACGRPLENIHVVFESSASGRVAFGGRIVS